MFMSVTACVGPKGTTINTVNAVITTISGATQKTNVQSGQANVALKDGYGNIAVATSSVTINLTSSSTNDYTVTPSVTISTL